jgi:hypothetical protein
MLARVVQLQEAAMGGEDGGRDERRDCERNDPGHDRIEYIIGRPGNRAGRA